MNNSSEHINHLFFGNHVSETSADILMQLNNFVSEKHYLFDYYKRHKHLNKPSLSRVFVGIIGNVNDFFLKSKIQKSLTISIAICLLIGVANKLGIIIFNDIIISTIKSIYLLLFYTQAIIFLYPNIIKGIRDISNFNSSKYISNVISYDISTHLKYAYDIGNNSSSKDIAVEKDRFDIAILDQTRSKEIGDSFIPLISIVYVALISLVLGGSKIISIGGVGVTTIITFLLFFIVKKIDESLLINQHCLFVLQKALTIAKEREKNYDRDLVG